MIWNKQTPPHSVLTVVLPLALLCNSPTQASTLRGLVDACCLREAFEMNGLRLLRRKMGALNILKDVSIPLTAQFWLSFVNRIIRGVFCCCFLNGVLSLMFLVCHKEIRCGVCPPAQCTGCPVDVQPTVGRRSVLRTWASLCPFPLDLFTEKALHGYYHCILPSSVSVLPSHTHIHLVAQFTQTGNKRTALSVSLALIPWKLPDVPYLWAEFGLVKSRKIMGITQL